MKWGQALPGTDAHPWRVSFGLSTVEVFAVLVSLWKSEGDFFFVFVRADCPHTVKVIGHRFGQC